MNGGNCQRQIIFSRKKLKLRSLESAIVRHCVNSCANCNHFAPLQKPYFMDIEVLKKDVLAITKVASFEKFSFLGGEPLLHPKIDEMMDMVKSLGLFKQIGITTNGQMLDKMSKDFWTLFNRLEVDIYPEKISDNQIDLTKRMCKEHGIDLQLNRISKFYKTCSPSSQTRIRILKRYMKCYCKDACFSIDEGYFYKCPQCIYIPSLFMNIEGKGVDGIPLEGITVEKLYDYLSDPIPLKSCSRCSVEEVYDHWHEISKEKWLKDSTITTCITLDEEKEEEGYDEKIRILKQQQIERKNKNFTIDYFTPNIPYWKNWLGKFRGTKDLRFLEVGSYEGRSALWLMQNILTHPTSTLDCFDTFEGGIDQKEYGDCVVGIRERFENNLFDYEDRITIHQGFSQELLRIMPLNIFDFIYIDGSHLADDTLEDAVLSFRLLKKGGIMIFDDYTWNLYPDPLMCPKAGIDSFLNIFSKKIRILGKYHQVCLEKIG